MSNPQVNISPPQYLIWRELAYSFGADPEIAVKPPFEDSEQWTINIRVLNDSRAPAVAGVLKDSYDLGGIRVKVGVLDEEGNAVSPPDISSPGFSVEQMIRTALFPNPYFQRVFRIENKPPMVPWGDLAVVFFPQTIEFWNDNLADPFGFVHFVAQDVFADVMRENYDGLRATFTTTPRETTY